MRSVRLILAILTTTLALACSDGSNGDAGEGDSADDPGQVSPAPKGTECSRGEALELGECLAVAAEGCSASQGMDRLLCEMNACINELGVFDEADPETDCSTCITGAVTAKPPVTLSERVLACTPAPAAAGVCEAGELLELANCLATDTSCDESAETLAETVALLNCQMAACEEPLKDLEINCGGCIVEQSALQVSAETATDLSGVAAACSSALGAPAASAN